MIEQGVGGWGNRTGLVIVGVRTGEVMVVMGWGW